MVYCNDCERLVSDCISSNGEVFFDRDPFCKIPNEKAMVIKDWFSERVVDKVKVANPRILNRNNDCVFFKQKSVRCYRGNEIENEKNKKSNISLGNIKIGQDVKHTC